MEGGDSPPNANGSARPFQSKKEKSTAILLAIILIFVACHLLRFIVQIYEVFSGPLHGSHKLYQVSSIHTTYIFNLNLISEFTFQICINDCTVLLFWEPIVRDLKITTFIDLFQLICPRAGNLFSENYTLQHKFNILQPDFSRNFYFYW